MAHFVLERAGMIAWLIPAAVLAQADAGTRWSQHPRIVAVREVVAEIDRQVIDAGTTWACALTSTADAPKTLAAWKKIGDVDLYGPDFETLEVRRASTGELERVTWHWERRGVSETEEHDSAEISRWSRAGAEVFVHVGYGSSGLGWTSVEVRAWSDARGARFWWATKSAGSEGKSERAGPQAENTPWLTPDTRLDYLRPCTAQQAARITGLAATREPKAADLPLIKATWVKRKPR